MAPQQLTHKQMKALAKASRPFYAKKRFIIPAVVVALIVVASVASSGGGSKSSTAKSGAPKNSIYPGRVGALNKDHEAAMGSPVEFSGYTTTVTRAEFRQKLSDFEDKGYVVAHVTISNRDKKTQSYSEFTFKIQTPDGQLHDANFSVGSGLLGSGQLVQGGKVEGDVTFDVGANPKGQFYVLYIPDSFDSLGRGVWGVKL
jgi:hypothetical protein